MKRTAARLRREAEEVDRYVAQFEAAAADPKSTVSEADVLGWCANSLSNIDTYVQGYINSAVEIALAKKEAE